MGPLKEVPLDDERLEDERLEDERLEDERLEDEELEDEELGDEAVEDERLEDEAIGDEAVEDEEEFEDKMMLFGKIIKFFPVQNPPVKLELHARHVVGVVRCNELLTQHEGIPRLREFDLKLLIDELPIAIGKVHDFKMVNIPEQGTGTKRLPPWDAEDVMKNRASECLPPPAKKKKT